MPGVPSGRGCEGCRKQKKKCDQGRPACSRCTRLSIPCVGSGQRRFKFKEQKLGLDNGQVVLSERALQSDRVEDNFAGVVSFQHGPLGSQAEHTQIRSLVELSNPSRPLCSDVAKVQGAFVHALEINDLRYDLRCFGAFITDVPRRLGENSALVASVKALTAAQARLTHTGSSVEAISAYGNGLRALREFLMKNPVQGTNVDTMVAVYFLMLAQGCLGKFDGCVPAHGTALAHLTNILTARGSLDRFEARVLCTVAIAVLGYSVLNRSLRQSAGLWRIGTDHNVLSPVYCDEQTRSEVLTMCSLGSITELFNDPEAHYEQVKLIYTNSKEEAERMKARSSGADPEVTEQKVGSREFSRLITFHGVMLAYAGMFNAIMQAFHPDDEALVVEAAQISDAILDLAERLMCYRPLGSSFMPDAVVSALTIQDVPREAELWAMLDRYELACLDSNWPAVVGWLRRKFARLRCKVERHGLAAVVGHVEAASDVRLTELEPIEDPEDKAPTGSCCVM